MLRCGAKEVVAEALVSVRLLGEVVRAHSVLLLLLLVNLSGLLEARRLHVLVELRASARDGNSSWRTTVPKVGINVAAVLVVHDAAVGHHRERWRLCHHRRVESCSRGVRIRAAGTVRHGANLKMSKLRSCRASRLEAPGITVVRSAREVRQLRNRCERVGCRAHTTAAADRAVETMRSARHVARHGSTRSSVKLKTAVACACRRARRHGRSTVGSARVLGGVRHLETVRSRTCRSVILDLESGEVVVFEALREGGAAVRRQGASVHRDRVAHDGSGTANTGVGAFSIGVVSTCVLSEGGFAAERLAAVLWRANGDVECFKSAYCQTLAAGPGLLKDTYCYQAFVWSSAGVDSPVTCERARVGAGSQEEKDAKLIRVSRRALDLLVWPP